MAVKQMMYVLPGQGSQYRGMGSDVSEKYTVAREVYAEASDALGYDIAALSFRDERDEIGLTRYTQPALMTHQIACLRVFEAITEGRVQPAMAAGHSLGEYTALVAAGSLSLADGLRLVKRRGELMGEHGEGGMVALSTDVETARPLADRHYCQIASCNLPKQTVVGGADDDLAAMSEYVAEHMPRVRAVTLKTEGAFHTYFMVTAARLFREVLDATQFNAPRVPVLSNYTAEVHDPDPDSIRTRLFYQLFNPVNWVGCLSTAMAAGVDTFMEFGGGLGEAEEPGGKRPNLESIIKKTLRAAKYEADYVPAINVETIEAAAQNLSA